MNLSQIKLFFPEVGLGEGGAWKLAALWKSELPQHFHDAHYANLFRTILSLKSLNMEGGGRFPPTESFVHVYSSKSLDFKYTWWMTLGPCGVISLLYAWVNYFLVVTGGECNSAYSLSSYQEMRWTCSSQEQRVELSQLMKEEELEQGLEG